MLDKVNSWKTTKRILSISLVCILFCMTLIGVAYNQNVFLEAMSHENALKVYLSMVVFFSIFFSIIFIGLVFVLNLKFKFTVKSTTSLILYILLSPVLILGVISFAEISNMLNAFTVTLFLGIIASYFYSDFKNLKYKK